LDDQAWVDILRSWGHVVSVVAWNDPNIAWKDFNILIPRLTYHHLNPTGFRCWLNLVDSLNHVVVLNPTDIHRWNLDKRYLQQLELIGIPIIPTVWLTRGVDSVSVLDRSSLLYHKALIVKPTISSVARGLNRIDGAHISELRESINRTLDWSDAMVQPFITSIQTCGEIRCIFLGHEFSYAIQKLPLPEDFRTNVSDNWKLLDRLEFPDYDNVITAAREALEAFLSLATSSSNPDSFRLLFAAVDMVLDADRRPLLMELEMTDPCLYLKSSHSNLAILFANCIISNAAVNQAQQYTRFCGPHRLIFPWQGPEVLFVRQTLQNPSSVALTSDIGPPVTYLELCRRAVCISEYISARRSTSIAILCQRTPNLISTILGCMFARLPYLLLNNSFPAARIEAMLRLSGIHHVLCEHSKGPIVDRFNRDIEVTVISDIMGMIPNVHIDNLHERLLCREPMEERINNLIFTSGSTGVPKGIRIRYQALANVVQHFTDDVLLQPCNTNVVFAHSTNISFDISAIPFFIPLAVGGRIALASDGCMQDPKLLKSFLYSSQSNYMLGTTSQYRLLIDSGWVPTPGNVCIQAGEVLSQKIASYILDRGSMLWNFYGPAETTIWSTGCCVKEASDPISIGLPIWNTEVILLDDAGNVNDEGEICIAGNGLGQYIAHEETYQRFQPLSLPGTITESKTADFFHTGDLARYSNGNIVYRGRVDTQIKIGGQRLELQEIELALKQHAKVSEAVVRYTTDNSQEGRLIAFVAPVVDAMELKGMLAKMLPQYMVPRNFIFVESFPLNSSGKIDGKVLIEQYGTVSMISPSIQSAALSDMASSIRHTKKLQDVLLTVFCQKLGLHKHQLNASDNIFDHGTTSILAVRMAIELSKQLGLDISVADIFENPSASRLGQKICMNLSHSGSGILRTPTPSANSIKDIAVINFAVRCTSASSPEELWHNIMGGKDTVFIPGQLETPSPRSWIQARTSLTNSVDFDRILFDMTKKQAQFTDPQHRLFLECAYEALESSGYTADDQNLRAGVFAAAAESTYFRHVLTNADHDQGTNHLIQTGTDMDYVSSLTAFKLDCRGPAMTIGTACSSSSVAIALGCDSLRAGRCDIAIAGGASVRFPAHNGYAFTEGYILSHDGRCRPFDENASGTVMTDGVGVIILKQLCNAVADGDDILAVIKGYSVLNDGSQKANFHSPSVQGQTRTMHDALLDAGISADSISYVETHGTGTVVGDAIEFKAISEILGSQSDELCHVGAIKGNIGHTNSASGVFGLIKLSLCLRKKKIPPLANFTGNPNLNAHQTRLRFPVNAMDWKVSGEDTKRVGLALSTGFGGTNAAFVLEEFDDNQERHHPQITGEVDEAVILPLSAATITALSLKRVQLAEFLEYNPNVSLQDVALTLRNGRRALPNRQAFIVKSVGDAVARLRKSDNWIPNRADRQPSLLFVFPGQGFRCIGLGAYLYEGSAVFRQALEDCLEILDQYHISEDVRHLLLKQGGISEKYSEDGNNGHSLLHVTQPSLFVLEYGIASLVRTAFGIPDGVLGYSFGEIVAACISGAVSLQGALSFVVARGRLMDRLPNGAMLSVRMSESNCSVLASELGLCVAAENGPDNFVLSGEISAISKAEMQLQDMGIAARRLDVTRAFHSKMMDSILDEFLEAITPYASTFKPPTIPLFSTVTGKQWDVGSPIPAAHWVEHIRKPVLFAAAMQIASQELPQVFAIEIGPKVLRTLIQQLRFENNKRVAVVDMFSCQDTNIHETLMVAAGKMWESGHDVVLKRCQTSLSKSPGHPAQRIKLPTYPFERVPCTFQPSTDETPEDHSYRINGAYINELTGKSGTSGKMMDLSALVALEHWDETETSDPAMDISATSILNVLESDLASVERLRGFIEQARQCADMQPFLNARALGHIYSTLQHLRLTNTEFPSENYTQAFTKAGVLGRHTRFCKRLIQLSKESVFAHDGDIETPFDHKTVEDDIIEACGNELTAILQGSTSAHNILFPILEDHYRSYPFHALSNYLAASIVRQFMQTNPPLRVLEVGAGTASFTSELLSHVSPESFELYLFTDVSRAFFAETQRQFSIFPYFKTELFNLEVHPALQGFKAGYFDVVIGSNCVHAVKDISIALRHLNWLIRPGGLLTLVEVFEPEIWQELVFGTLPGWWHFEDMLVRQSSLLLGWEAWREALKCAGFGNIQVQPAAEIPELARYMKEGVITAYKTIQCLGLDTLKEVSISWCQLLLDDHSLSAALPTVLQHHDVHFVIERDVNAGELQSALHMAQSAGRKCCIILGQTNPGYNMLQDFDEENRRRMQRDTCEPLLKQLQKLADIDPESLTALRIIVVTRSAQCVTRQNTQSLNGLQLLGSLVLGICRSAVQEIPSVELVAVDLDVGTDPQIDVVAIAREIFAAYPEPEVAYRRSARLVRRIISGARSHGLARNRMQDPSNLWNIRANATYIVAGSSGGLGQLIVRDLLQRGAKYILLLSRSLERYNLTGLHLPQTSRVACVDIGDFKQLSAIIEKMRAVMPPFCTVFHAAGTLSDGTMINQTWDTFETVLRSKVDGTLNLLHVLEDDSLDNFVLFGSIVGALGNAGQVNHAAACCFESSIARLLTSQGRSVMAIEWGPWRDVGAASSPTVLARMLQRGLESISPTEGLAALRAVTYSAPVDIDGSHTASLIIARVDWNRFGNSFPTYARQALFESTGLTTPKSNVQNDVGNPEATSLPSPLGIEFESKIERTVFQIVADVLGQSYHDLSLTTPLLEYGLDSLSVISLVRHLNKKLAVHFRPQQFLTISECTIKGLATLVDTQLKPDADSARNDQELVILSKGLDGNMPFFLFHGAGGAIYMLQDLATSLSALTGRSAMALWPAGLTDDHYETDIDSLASRYSNNIVRYCSGPYDFIGYSLGGGIAAACASILYRDHRIHVQNLVLLDTPTPSAMRLGGLTTIDDVHRYLTELDPSLQLHQSYESFEKFAKLFLHHCRIYKIWKPSITAGIKHMFFVKSQERNGEWEPVDPEADWRQLTTQKISTGVTLGNHSTMLIQPQGAILANLIRTYLQTA
jgi:acyl transferase domain-containing protein/non-ribosomal peptide synthetase component F/thioesterase domain-containing protein/acyl carrier protein/NAD(P)-dependent dehydrogenase (short-subunit alcohol dehydrogenase family)